MLYSKKKYFSNTLLICRLSKLIPPIDNYLLCVNVAKTFTHLLFYKKYLCFWKKKPFNWMACTAVYCLCICNINCTELYLLFWLYFDRYESSTLVYLFFQSLEVSSLKYISGIWPKSKSIYFSVSGLLKTTCYARNNNRNLIMNLRIDSTTCISVGWFKI